MRDAPGILRCDPSNWRGEHGFQGLIKRLAPARGISIARKVLFDGGENRVFLIDDVVEIVFGQQPVLSNEGERFDREPSIVQVARLAADQTQEPIRDRVALQRAARQRDLGARMANHIIGFQHAESRIDPAKIRLALVERRRDRQKIAFRDLTLSRLDVRFRGHLGERAVLEVHGQSRAKGGESDEQSPQGELPSALISGKSVEGGRLGAQQRGSSN
jgi:hypothetical protein